MQIRDEQAGDIDAIRALHTIAFGQSQEAGLVDQLRADGDSVISLVAIEADSIVGHILFSPMSAPFQALGLAPLAVQPAMQGRGIGSALVEAGLQRVAAGPWRAVFVLGDPAYYGRFGFEAALASGFRSPYAGPYLMALALGGPLPVREGRIDYAPAFAALG
ncbi:MAG: GNAT family N-acetyltransferase [Rhizobiales bacterium 62-17]|nr:N-acetyltransferase [Hyphomicrobiales bacterium]OJY00115.1 MAG: GNAT family N-acetyltransferase [Rhizobiales bacterium 62-17]